jgi:hypothetical protein
MVLKCLLEGVCLVLDGMDEWKVMEGNGVNWSRMEPGGTGWNWMECFWVKWHLFFPSISGYCPVAPGYRWTSPSTQHGGITLIPEGSA